MVDGRRRRTRLSPLLPQYCRPAGPAIANHLNRHDAHDQVSRRRVALDARNQSPRTSEGMPAAQRGPVLGSAPTERNQGKGTQTPHTREHDNNKDKTQDTDRTLGATGGARRQEQSF